MTFETTGTSCQSTESAVTDAGQTLPYLSDRDRAMQRYGVWACPQWCVQDPKEDQAEQHWGDWSTLTTHEHQDVVQVRPRMSWWSDPDGTPDEKYVEVRIVSDDPQRPSAYLSSDDLDRLREMIDDAEAEMDDGYFDEKWAYPGAEDDFHNAEDQEQDTTTSSSASDDCDGM